MGEREWVTRVSELVRDWVGEGVRDWVRKGRSPSYMSRYNGICDMRDPLVHEYKMYSGDAHMPKLSSEILRAKRPIT